MAEEPVEAVDRMAEEPKECPRCPSSVLEWEEVVPAPSSLDGGEEWCRGLLCRSCGTMLLLEGGEGRGVLPPDTWLAGGNLPDGWSEARGPEHLWRQAVLTNVVNFLQEPADPARRESDLRPAAPGDRVGLCWSQGAAIGFAVTNTLGSKVPGDPSTTYGLNILSAVFIRKSHRRRGLARQLIHTLLTMFPK